MFERRVVFIQLGIFTGLLLLIFGTISLMDKGIIPRNSVSIFIPIEMIGSVILAWTLIGKYQRSKIFRPLIEDKLKEQGYSLLSERPLNMGEILGSLEFAPTILINGTPLESFTYKAHNERMLHVRTDHGTDLLLHAVITKTWRNKIKLEIIKKSRAD